MGNTNPKETEKVHNIQVKNDAVHLSNMNLLFTPKELNSLTFNILDLSYNSISEIHEELSKVEITELSLSSNKLVTLPKNLENLKSLKTLKLSSNKLSKSIPKEILNLPNLTNLDISHNENLSECEKVDSTSLQKVMISSCKLSKFPKGIAEIPSLKILEMIYNTDITFDDDDTIESNLETLIFSSCNLPSIPKIIGSMKSLEMLNLSYNKISAFESIQNLKNLKHLLLSHNQLSEISNEFECLSNLRIIDLDHNKLKEFPTFISKLKDLEELYIGYNEIEELPKSESGELFTPNLKKFNITNNHLKEIPEEFLKNYLLNSNSLQFQSNHLISFSSLKDLTSLQEITLNENQISNIPELPTNLEKLMIDFNLISTIDDHVYDLKELKHLHLRGNKISKIDKKISNLQNLEVLLLDKNHLQELPTDEIVELGKGKLQHLGCSDNGFDTIPYQIKTAVDAQQFKARTNFSSSSPDLIIENLYLGSVRSASNRALIERLQIKNVLSVAKGMQPYHQEVIIECFNFRLPIIRLFQLLMRNIPICLNFLMNA
jgi:leucine-rich repeat protein SHOC2